MKTPVAALPSWRVIQELQNGGRIHGCRRALGEVFDAPESAVTFYVLEGLVEAVPAPVAATPAVKPAA